MKKTRRCTAAALILLLALSGCGGSGPKAAPEETTLAQAQSAYLQCVDTDYSYRLAQRLEDIRSNEALGYRTAGSEAELKTGDLLKVEMESIGLSDVEKEAFTLDTWTFAKAELTYRQADGTETVVNLGGYQTDFSTRGVKSYQVIDGGRGTAADLDGLDVEGKLVLIDIDQRADWWINYPAYEAHLRGAAAVLAAQAGGYGEISDEALNAQDVCGPADAAAFSISQADAQALRLAMEAQGTSELAVTLDAESRVELDGTSYNIVGRIPGRDPDAMVLMSAHYDSYFSGFQDDNAAIALMLGIAKGILDSGYQPEKTLVFCAMAAEEWGTSDTRYDWSTGAYNQIFRLHPEWAGKIVADINFELPALDAGDEDLVRSSYELKTYLEEFKNGVPAVEGAFPAGVSIIAPTQTWSDDFSLSIAGVPATVTALRGDFAQTTYHSQFDTGETYSPEVFLFHHNFYGMLMLAYDRCAVSPLDFSNRLSALRDTMDESILTADQAEALSEALDRAETAAAGAWDRVTAVNGAYLAALDSGDREEAGQLYEASRDLNAGVLAAFRYAEDSFVRLTWEDSSIFPHQHSQGNLAALDGAISALEAGDVDAALDEYLYLVDNNWYAYDWSRETYDRFTNYVLDQPADRLLWGAGRVQGHIDLYDVIHSLQNGADPAEALSALWNAREQERLRLEDQVTGEVQALEALAEQLAALSETV